MALSGQEIKEMLFFQVSGDSIFSAKVSDIFNGMPKQLLNSIYTRKDGNASTNDAVWTVVFSKNLSRVRIEKTFHAKNEHGVIYTIGFTMDDSAPKDKKFQYEATYYET